MNASDAFNEINRLNLVAKVKAELFRFYLCFRNVGNKILAFIKRHRHLSESLLLGAIVAFLCSRLPGIGGFLALLALVTSAAVGLMLELRDSLNNMFSDGPLPA